MNKRIKRSIVLQHGQSDCGVACLASITKYYRGTYHFDTLRTLSGTTKEGSTMLGLYQAAEQTGFEPQAYEASIEDIKNLSQPIILHVVLHEYLQHYVVCYGYHHDRFIIGDPAKGISFLSAEELNDMWKSHAFLQLTPTGQLVKKEEDRQKQWRWILELGREDLAILSLALFLGLIITVLGFSQAIFSQVLIDRIIPSGDTQQLFLGLGLLGVLLLFNTGLSAVRNLFLLRQSRDFNTRIVGKFFQSLLFLPKPFFDTRKIGDFIARLNDTSRIQGVISHLLSSVLIDVLVLLVSLAFVFYYSALIGWVLLGSIPVFVTLAWFYNPKIARYQKEVMEAYALNESNYVDTIGGIGAIKSAGKESVFQKATLGVYRFFQQRAFAMGKFGVFYSLLSGSISFLVNLSVIGLTAWLVMQERMQLGEMVALMTMAGNVLPSVNTLVGTVISLQEARVAFDRMYEFASQKPEYRKKEESTPNWCFDSLKAKNVSFRFPGRRLLLSDVSFLVKRGEMIALLGESGAGKSTIMQILQKFYEPASGDLTINNQPWNQIPITHWRNTLGVVPQQIKLFNGTLLDNIYLGNSSAEAQQIIAFCQSMGFSTYFESFPQGYVTLLGEEGVKLSGGQQQLVALARALYRQPQLLLLDEATSAMDRNTEGFVLSLLEKLKSQMGIILITHRIQTARQADQIYILEDGQTTTSGTHFSLMNTDNLYSNSISALVDY